jgi:formiminoglutamase
MPVSDGNATRGSIAAVVSRADPNPANLPYDEGWPRAGHWLAAGPGRRDVDLAVVGVPAFTSARPAGRLHATPAAVRRALHHYTTWCASRRVDVADLVPWDVGDVDDPDGDDGEWRTTTTLRTALGKATAVIAVGGDGTVTYPVVTAAAPTRAELAKTGLVMIDGFFDVRDGTGSMSSLRRLLDAGLRADHVVHIGAADWLSSRAHADELTRRGVRVVAAGELEASGVDAGIRDAIGHAADADVARSVHVSLDFSACDRSAAPAAVDAVPGGLGAATVRAIAFAAGRDPRVRSLDIVEIDATADSADQRTVRLAALVVLEFAAGLALRPGGG